MDEQKSWISWSNHVLTELKRLDRQGEKIAEEISDMDKRMDHKFMELHTAVSELKTRSSIWGAVAGTAFGAVVSAIVSYVTSGHK